MAIFIDRFTYILAIVNVDNERIRGLFLGWGKQLISSMLQPIMVFTSVLVFNLLFIMIFRLTLSFSVCKTCFLFLYFLRNAV